MADISSQLWSETASENDAAVPDGWPENMPRSGVNNAAREMMSAIKREWNRTHLTRVTTGTGTAYALSYDQPPPAYVQGMTFAFTAHVTSGASPTLNVDLLGAKKLRRFSSTGTVVDVVAGEIPIALPVIAHFDENQDAFLITSYLPPLGLVPSKVAFGAAVYDGSYGLTQSAFVLDATRISIPAGTRKIRFDICVSLSTTNTVDTVCTAVAQVLNASNVVVFNGAPQSIPLSSPTGAGHYRQLIVTDVYDPGAPMAAGFAVAISVYRGAAGSALLYQARNTCTFYGN